MKPSTKIFKKVSNSKFSLLNEVRDKKKNMTINGKEWGISFAMLLTAIALPTALYISLSVTYGSVWPDEWAKKDGYGFILFVALFIPAMSAKYLALHNNVNVEKLLYKSFDIEEFKDKKIFEAILSHYTNMASVGLMLAILIFTLKPFVENQSIYLIGLPLAILTFLILLLYGILFLKPVVRFAKCPLYIYFPVMLLILSVDMQGFKLFISSVPN